MANRRALRYPRNWPRPLWVRIFGSQDRGRGRSVLTTDNDIQIGPPVVRLPRDVYMHYGISGARSTRGWPETSDSMVSMPHIFVQRTAGRAIISGKQSDDRANIPAIYIGNPTS